MRIIKQLPKNPMDWDPGLLEDFESQSQFVSYLCKRCNHTAGDKLLADIYHFKPKHYRQRVETLVRNIAIELLIRLTKQYHPDEQMKWIFRYVAVQFRLPATTISGVYYNSDVMHDCSQVVNYFTNR